MGSEKSVRVVVVGVILRKSCSPDQVERAQNLERVATRIEAVVEDLSDLASAVVHVRDRAVRLVLDSSSNQITLAELRIFSVLEDDVFEILENDDDPLVH